MTTQHTPGPWVQADGNNYRRGVVGDIAIVGSDLITIGILYGGHRDAEANARLMAAAPDLLEALKEWLYFCDQNGGDKDFSFGPKTRAAIAKAEGR